MSFRRSRRERGAALLTAIFVAAFLAMLVAGLLNYVHNQRVRGIQSSRAIKRVSCAEAGLQYARSYFAKNFASWNTYLRDPSHYNPIQTGTFNTTPANPMDPVLQGTSGHPELFTDLDGDSFPDVYIYIRDNDDEALPASPNWAKDNDQTVIVGAVCISSTLAPLRQDGKVDTARLTLESILSFNLTHNQYGPNSNNNW